MSARSRTLALLAAVAFCAGAAPANAATATVESMVVGRAKVLAPAAQVRAGAANVKVGGRTCKVGAATPLAVLAAVRKAGGPAFALRDYGTCSKRTADAGGLFVRRIGAETNKGQDGWVYKVDGRNGTTPAADPSGAFGTGRLLRTGQRVLWFWCDMGTTGCQRTLRVDAPRTVSPTGALTVRVQGVDDRGKATPVAGAAVTAGTASATTAADGTATLAGPWSGTITVEAAKAGLVPSFPEEVLAG